MELPPALTLDQLRNAVQAKTVDTVVLALTDMQGRLQGKRLTAPYFLDAVLEHGSEACNYLLAVDVEMNTVDGYAMSSWERGYGDFELKPDLGTLRLTPFFVLAGATVTPDAHTHGDDVHVTGVVVSIPEELEQGFMATLPEFLADAYGAED